MIPRVNAPWHAAERNFRNTNVMTSRRAGKRVDTHINQAAKPYNPLQLSNDHWHREKVFKGSDRSYQVKSIVWEREMAYVTTDQSSINVPDLQTQLPLVQPTSKNISNAGPTPLRSVNEVYAINPVVSCLQKRILRSEGAIPKIQNPRGAVHIIKIGYNILLSLCGNLHFAVCPKPI